MKKNRWLGLIGTTLYVGGFVTFPISGIYILYSQLSFLIGACILLYVGIQAEGGMEYVNKLLKQKKARYVIKLIGWYSIIGGILGMGDFVFFRSGRKDAYISSLLFLMGVYMVIRTICYERRGK